MDSNPPPSYHEATQPPYPTTASPLFPQPAVTPSAPPAAYNPSMVPLNQPPPPHGFIVPSESTTVVVNPSRRLIPSHRYGDRSSTCNGSTRKLSIFLIICGSMVAIAVGIILLVLFLGIRTHHSITTEVMDESNDIDQQLNDFRRKYDNLWPDLNMQSDRLNEDLEDIRRKSDKIWSDFKF